MRWIAAIAIAALCVADACNAHARPIPDTVLIDQRGATFTLRELRGKPIVLTFISTRCRDACPIAESVFARLAQQRLDGTLVTITLDPQYDTPSVMARYARNLDANVKYWRLASGNVADVRSVVTAFGVTSVTPDVHSTAIFVLDDRGRLRNILPLSTATYDVIRNVFRAWLEPIAQRHGKRP